MGQNIYIIYEKGSETIRVMPYNYMLAYKGCANATVIDPDGAIPLSFATKVFELCQEHKWKFEKLEHIALMLDQKTYLKELWDSKFRGA